MVGLRPVSVMKDQLLQCSMQLLHTTSMGACPTGCRNGKQIKDMVLACLCSAEANVQVFSTLPCAEKQQKGGEKTTKHKNSRIPS